MDNNGGSYFHSDGIYAIVPDPDTNQTWAVVNIVESSRYYSSNISVNVTPTTFTTAFNAFGEHPAPYVNLGDGGGSNSNNAPTNISLSSLTIAENAGADAVVGTLSTTDPDASNTFTYTLVTGTGSTDNGSFNIFNNQLRATASFDFETKSSYYVRVRSTDQGNLTFDKSFTITVTDANETSTPETFEIINNKPCIRKSNNQYYINFRNNKAYVFLNNNKNVNVFYKIKSTPSSRGYALNYKPDGHLYPDDTLYFLHSELGDGNFEVKVFAFFTGAPPIAHINEPAAPVFANQFFMQPNIHEITSVAAQAGTVAAETISTINNLQSINDGYTDSYEPKTFYDYGSNVLGYFVEIQITVNSTSLMTGASHSTGPLANLPGQFFRWAGTIIDQQTTLQNGIIIARKINP